MKMKYEREQGMTSIYRKLRKECRSFNVRRHLATLILAVAMMAPAAVYADWTGVIQSEKPAGQAAEAEWASPGASPGAGIRARVLAISAIIWRCPQRGVSDLPSIIEL